MGTSSTPSAARHFALIAFVVLGLAVYIGWRVRQAAREEQPDAGGAGRTRSAPLEAAAIVVETRDGGEGARPDAPDPDRPPVDAADDLPLPGLGGGARNDGLRMVDRGRAAATASRIAYRDETRPPIFDDDPARGAVASRGDTLGIALDEVRPSIAAAPARPVETIGAGTADDISARPALAPLPMPGADASPTPITDAGRADPSRPGDRRGSDEAALPRVLRERAGPRSASTSSPAVDSFASPLVDLGMEEELPVPDASAPLPSPTSARASSPAAPMEPTRARAASLAERSRAPAETTEAMASPPRGPARGDFHWYTSADGDTLSRIAKERLGSARRWRDIYALNKDRLASPDVVPEGIELRIPGAGESRQPQIAVAAGSDGSDGTRALSPPRFNSHVVREGESLHSLAIKYYGETSPALLRRIRAANPSLRREEPRAGMTLVIPILDEGDRGIATPATPSTTPSTTPSATDDARTSAVATRPGAGVGRGRDETRDARRRYTIQPGDSLWRIAARELGDGTRWEEIRKVNRRIIPNPNRLPIGTTIVLP